MLRVFGHKFSSLLQFPRERERLGVLPTHCCRQSALQAALASTDARSAYDRSTEADGGGLQTATAARACGGGGRAATSNPTRQRPRAAETVAGGFGNLRLRGNTGNILQTRPLKLGRRNEHLSFYVQLASIQVDIQFDVCSLQELMTQ